MGIYRIHAGPVRVVVFIAVHRFATCPARPGMAGGQPRHGAALAPPPARYRAMSAPRRAATRAVR